MRASPSWAWPTRRYAFGRRRRSSLPWDSMTGRRSAFRRLSCPRSRLTTIFTPRANTASICWRSYPSARCRRRWLRKADPAMANVSVTVNGEMYDVSDVEPRLLLCDFLRDRLGLTGTHVGCEHGVCGACTVLVNGDSVRSCLMLAIQAGGAEITTVEGLGSPEQLNGLQAQFR